MRQESRERSDAEQARIAELEAEREAPAAPGLSSEAIDKLTQLGKLHEQGVLTDNELAEQKVAILGG